MRSDYKTFFPEGCGRDSLSTTTLCKVTFLAFSLSSSSLIFSSNVARHSCFFLNFSVIFDHGIISANSSRVCGTVWLLCSIYGSFSFGEISRTPFFTVAAIDLHHYAPPSCANLMTKKCYDSCPTKTLSFKQNMCRSRKILRHNFP